MIEKRTRRVPDLVRGKWGFDKEPEEVLRESATLLL